MNLPSFKKARRPSAYILMEVMLATAIFAIAAVSLAIVLNEAIAAGIRVQRETQVVWNLETQLNQARLLPLAAGKQTSKPDTGGIVYEQEITQLNLKNRKNVSLTGLYDIKITAHWKEENRDTDLVAQTYVYQQ